MTQKSDNRHGRTDEVCAIMLYQTPAFFASKKANSQIMRTIVDLPIIHHEMGRGYYVSTLNINERALHVWRKQGESSIGMI